MRESGVRVSENLRFKTPTAPNSSPRVLDLTGQILEYNAAHYTVWHIRRKCLFASQRRRLKTKESIPELASLELWRRQLFVYERSRRRRARATCYSLCSFVCRGTREIFSAVAWTHSSAPSFGATQARVGRRRRHDSRRARVRERLPRDSLSLSLSLSLRQKCSLFFATSLWNSHPTRARVRATDSQAESVASSSLARRSRAPRTRSIDARESVCARFFARHARSRGRRCSLGGASL